MTSPRALLTIAACGALCCAALATDDDKASRADEIKAVFMYKFTGYVTWPDDEAKTFTIAVLGDNSLLEPLKAIADKKTVDTKALVIRECRKIEETTGAQILLISGAMEGRLDSILKKAETEKMLTVGSSPGLARKGVAINFCTIEDRVGFEINLSAVKRSGLSVSSQLVKLATLVDEDKQSDVRGQSK